MRSAIVLFLLVGTGCTHHQLRYSAVQQARTVADIHTQQVLNNVAKFVHDRHALPHFSYPYQGAAGVTDNQGGNAGFAFTPFDLNGWSLGVNGSRTNSESYLTTPVNDPAKLELMRCAYQRAIFGCNQCGESCFCPDCQKRFNQFYLGSTTISKTAEVTSNGNRVFRVKPGVDLVTMWDDGEYVGFTSVEDVDGDYVLEAQRNDENNVVYTFKRLEGNVDQYLPIPQGPLFKLQEEPFRSIQELEEVLKNNDLLVEIYAGSELMTPDRVRKALDRNEILKYRNNLYLTTNITGTRGSTDSTKSAIFKTLKDALADATLDQKKQARLTFVIPAALDAQTDLESIYVDNTVAENSSRTGRVTAACLCDCPWLECGSRRDILRKARKGYVGHHKGTYVWVPPHGREQLARLTLTILDIALNSSPASPTTEVYAFVGADGKSTTTYDKAQYLAKATLGRGKNLSGLLPSSADSTQPPRDEEIEMLATVRDNLRLAMIRTLVQDLGITDLFALIERLGIREKGSVEYVGSDYILRKLDIQNGDLMIAVAAALLTQEGQESLQAMRPMPFTEASTELISEAARDYLNAESRLQALVGVAAPPDASPPVADELAPVGVQPRINALQFQQSIEFLGL